MGRAKLPVKVKLIVGMISNNLELFLETQDLLSKEFGNIDSQSDIMNFSHTDYYNKEMGENLKRKFLSFQKLIYPDRISDIKLTTNSLEQKFLNTKGGRKINLDPGYVSDSKLVLATTKNYYHRIYLKSGIYAEVTLYYKDDSFKSFDWTYPDYRTKEYIEFFNEVRRIYMEQMKQAASPGYR